MDLATLLLAAAVILLFVLRARDRAQLDEVVGRIRAFDAAQGTSPGSAVAEPAVAEPVRAGPVRQPAELLPELDDFQADAHLLREKSTLERIVAEHALALVGGLFVLVAAVLFVGFAIEQGWIGPWAKFGLAMALAAGLVLSALRVAARLPREERHGRAIGSLHGVLAATGAGVAFIAIVAGVRVQELFSAGAGAVLEVAVSAGAVQIARRWRSQDLAALGIGVGLAAPMLVGAEATAGTVLLLAVTIVAAVILAAVERWPRLLLGAALVTAPQVASFTGGAELGAVVAVVLGWWAVLAAGCVATARQMGGDANRSIVSTVFVIALGAAAFVVEPTRAADNQWAFASFLFVLALFNVLVGALLLRGRDRCFVLASAFIAAGAAAAATGISDATDGAGRVAGWSAEVVALTLLWWRVRGVLTALFASGLALLAVAHVITLDAPPTLLVHPEGSLVRPLVGIASIVLAAFAIRLLQRRAGAVEGSEETAIRRSTEALGLVGTWYAGAIVAVHVVGAGGGTDATAQLTLAAWAAVGAILAATLFLATRRGETAVFAGIVVLLELVMLLGTAHDHAAILLAAAAAVIATAFGYLKRTDPMALAPLGMGAIQAAMLGMLVLMRVPVHNLRVWSADPIAEALGSLLLLVAALLVLAVAVRRWEHADDDLRRAAAIAAVLAVWYTISVAVVALFTSEPAGLEQDAQVALTLTWVALGVGALFAGTSRRLREHVELRVGAYALLGLGALKLVLADTAELETPMRVLAFLATGLGLLGSAALEQRMRAGEGPD